MYCLKMIRHIKLSKTLFCYNSVEALTEINNMWFSDIIRSKSSWGKSHYSHMISTVHKNPDAYKEYSKQNKQIGIKEYKGKICHPVCLFTR